MCATSSYRPAAVRTVPCAYNGSAIALKGQKDRAEGCRPRTRVLDTLDSPGTSCHRTAEPPPSPPLLLLL